MRNALLFLIFVAAAYGQTGLGASTYTCVDKDGDKYGVGPGCLGPDADDNDATVQTGAQAIAKYGSLKSFLAHLGYNPTHIFYLSPTGNDGTGVMDDPTHPFQTWAEMNLLASKGIVAPGTMIMFRGGTWTNTTLNPISGAAGRPMILMSYPGERAIIDNRATGATTMNTTNQSYFIIDGLKVTGGASSGSGCIAGATTDANTTSLFHDNIFRNIEAVQCGQGIILMNGLQNITVEDNLFHDSSAGGQHCLYIGARGLPNSNIFVHRNICYNAAWNGFHLNGRFTNLQVEQNVIYGTGIAGFSLQEGISNSVFRNNLIFNTASAGIEISNYPGDCSLFGQGGTGSICPYDQTGNVFENNTIYQSAIDPTTGVPTAWPAVYVYNYSVGQVGDLGHQTFRNNIFVGHGQSGHYPPVVFRDGSKDYLATSTFVNNALWSFDGPTDPYVVGWGYNPSYGYQGYTCAQAPKVTSMSGCMNVDPGFVDAILTYNITPTKFNFGIGPTSPAIMAGTATGAPTADLVGASRTTPPSLGAYEPNSATSSSGTIPVVSSLACTASTLLSGGTANCTVTLSIAAPATGSTVTLTSTSLALTVPATVFLSPGATTTAFTATVGSLASSLTAILTASLGGGSATASFALTAASAVLSGVSCTPASVVAGGSASCTVTLSGAAGSGGATVSLSSNNSLLTVPTVVAIASGSASAGFTATAGAVSASQTAQITAAFGGVSVSTSVNLATASTSVSGAGWYDLPNTLMQSVCPANNTGGISYAFSTYCYNVVNAWGGAIADTKRNRLIVWGGGHVDYSGNEVYALNLTGTSASWTRLTNPSPLPTSGCPDAAPDGAPVSRHTYNNLAYMTDQDRMFSFDGGKAPCGNASGHTWTLDLSTPTPQWHAMDPVNGFNTTTSTWNAYANCIYDPNTKTVICNDEDIFMRYTPSTNSYAILKTGQHPPFSSTAVLDPVRKLIIFMGHEYQATTPLVKVVDISAGSNFVMQDWSSQVTGCAALAGANYPGLQYDSALDRIVGWPGKGNTVYVFNPDTKTCTAQTFSGGPPANPVQNGTFGRFNYFPALDAFVVVTSTSNDAYLLKLTAGASTVTAASACDLNSDGVVNSTDVQLAVNQAIGATPCGSAGSVTGGSCNVVSVQRVINASLGGACVTGN